MSDEVRIGVFLCRCAENISGVIDLEAMTRALEPVDGVAFVVEQDLMCGPGGIEALATTLRERGATHAVVAACSPKDHEQDFREGLERAGINPYLLQMANIREHCAWVTSDRDRALSKAVAMTRAAIRRVRHHEALSRRAIEADPDLLVIGGGVAGIEAALAAASAGRRVTLVEAAPSLGGRVPRYEEVAPTLECGPCMIAPRLSAVAAHERVRVMTNADVEEVVGFLGAFTATVRVRPRYVDASLCIGCDECMEACPADGPSDFDEGLSRRKAIDILFAGAVPNCAAIDPEVCLRFHGEPCTACALACPMEAIDFEQTEEVVEVKAGALVLATGFEPYDPSPLEALAYGENPAVHTLSELERLASASGPTAGEIRTRSGASPRSVAVLHCVGRSALGACSGVCCEPALKIAPALAREGIEAEVVHLHTDLVLPTRRGAALRQTAEQAGARFVRLGDRDATRVEEGPLGAVVHSVDEAGRPCSLDADMVVLVCGLGPATSTARLAEMLDLVVDDAGFLAADHPTLRPAQSSLDGVYLAGCAGGPRSIAESITSAHAAVGLALSRIRPGETLDVEVLTAEPDDERCCRCLVCLSACPYSAVTYDEARDRVEVNEVLCRGCGACVAGCASGAARARHFTDRQVYAEIEEVLRD